jgi:hypothetical protein
VADVPCHGFNSEISPWYAMMGKVSEADWREALDAIPQILAAAEIEMDGQHGPSCYDFAVNTLISMRRTYNPKRGTFRQYTYRAVHRAVLWAKSQSKTETIGAIANCNATAKKTVSIRFDSDQLDLLPPGERKAVILHVHLGLSRYETGLLLGGICNSRVKDRLRRAAVRMGIIAQ